MQKLKGVCTGAGYFSRFQYEAWTRIPEVDITALYNRSEGAGEALAKEYDVAKVYHYFEVMLDTEKPDFVDIITPPVTHKYMCKAAAERGIHTICQKPLAQTYHEAKEIVDFAEKAGIRFMVHENFRFQPWYREIKKIIDDGTLGNIHSLYFRMRTGDGWSAQAYLDRQPYFRNMKKFFVYETGIHFIDTFRYLLGEINEVYARLRKLNPQIAGEDCGLLTFTFESGAVGLLDANRYNEPNYENPRYTFGEMLLEGKKGSLRLYPDGRITLQVLGEAEKTHIYHHQNINFAGDCVYTTQRHFVDSMLSNTAFETAGSEYLKSLRIQEAAYNSAETGKPEKTA